MRQKNHFRELVSLVNEYLEGYTNLSESEIKRRIQETYEDDDLDGSQYDYLVGLLIS